MKPPTIEELRKLAKGHHFAADFHDHQAKHSNMSVDERKTEIRLEREEKLTALALERWAVQLEQKGSFWRKRATHKAKA